MGCLPIPAFTLRDLLAFKKQNAEQLLEELNQQGIVSMTSAEYQYDAKGFWICKVSVNGKCFERVGPRQRDAYRKCALSALGHIELFP